MRVMYKKLSFAIFLLAIFVIHFEGFSGRTWYQKAPIGGEARHRCTAFSIGNKGYIGGGHINSGTLITYEDYWEYDPATNSWTQIADFGGGLRYHSSAFTIDGYGYVGCGENSTHEYTNDFWKYVPEVNTWFPIADLPGQTRRGGTAFVIDGIAYYGSGQSDLGYHTDFYAYDPETNEWTPVADFIGEPRSASVSFSYGGKGYMGTGHKVGEALNDFYEYNPELDEWTEKAPVGGSIRQDAMGFCIDGKGYIGTGNDNLGTDFKDIWEYDFEADTWTQIEDFGGAKRRYAVTFIIDHTVYLGSGTDGTNFRDFWAYSPTLSIIEDELKNVSVDVYPNPSTNIIHVQSEYPADFKAKMTYSISDISGRTIVESTKVDDHFELLKSDFGSGTFFLNVAYEDQIFLSQKFIFN